MLSGRGPGWAVGDWDTYVFFTAILWVGWHPWYFLLTTTSWTRRSVCPSSHSKPTIAPLFQAGRADSNSSTANCTVLGFT